MAGEATKVIEPKVLWGGGRSPFSISYGKMMMWFFLISDALTFGGLLTSLGVFKHKFMDIWPTSDEVFHAFPFAGDTHLPLIYVALMTFILIVSSVTMVLAVEAGHRMDRRKVSIWMAATVVGGFFFLFSQVWEWGHYIHGSDLGALKMADRNVAQYTDAEGHKLEYFSKLQGLNEQQILEMEEASHVLRHSDDYFPKEVLDAEKTFKSLLISSGVQVRRPEKSETGEHVIFSGSEAAALINNSSPIFGANLHQNEYGVKQYSQFFFFITGFHGFHVFSGVIINLIILIGVLKGTFHGRGHYEMVEKVGLYWHFVDLVWVFVFTFYYLI